MSFSVPAFPLLCNIWTGPWSVRELRVSNVPCNLAYGRRVGQNFQTGFLGDGPGGCSNLLLPALTDVRDASQVSGYDVIEVVPGSGRWYATTMVDDVGKGFPNEYRFALLAKVSVNLNNVEFPGVYWPTPIP